MNGFDAAGFAAIHGLSGRNIAADIAAMAVGWWMAYLLGAGFFAFLFTRKGMRRRIYIFTEGALAVILSRGIIAAGIQFLYHRERPFAFYGISPLFGTTGWSFPSGHMTLFFALATVVWFANRRWGAWYLLLTAAMGAARIYAGLHWPTDIIAGAAIGIASALVVRWLLTDARKGIDRNEAPPAESGAAVISPTAQPQ